MLVRPEANPTGEHLKGTPLEQAQALVANIGLGWKGMPGTNQVGTLILG